MKTWDWAITAQQEGLRAITEATNRLELIYDRLVKEGGIKKSAVYTTRLE